MTRLCLIGSTVLFALALLCCPQAGAQAARESLLLCAQTVLPALFPFFVLSHLSLELGLGRWLGKKLGPVMSPLFHVSGAGSAALALGLVGGYPAGAAAVCSLLERRLCSREEAQRLLLFCNNAGPAFILSVAGGAVFRQPLSGLLLLAVHALSALLTGFLLRGQPVPRAAAAPPEPQRSGGGLLPQAVSRALSSSLQVCAYVVLFGVLLGLLRTIGAIFSLSLPPALGVLLTGGLELTNGIAALPEVGSPTLRLALCGFLLGWGGLSVHCQTAALLEGSGLRLAPYLAAKALQGLLSAGLLALAAPLCRGALRTGLSGVSLTQAALSPASLVIGALLWSAVFLLLTKETGKTGTERV